MAEADAETSKTLVILDPETVIHVLHVDDDEDFLVISKRMLEQHGSFHIESVSSVKEALQKIKQKDYDVVISDYRMPEMTGLDFLKELRAVENNVPFILFTGEGREEIAIEALNFGADRYFNKNETPTIVYEELRHSLKKAAKAKRAAEALQNSEEKYRKQFERALDAIILADAETGVIVDCNVAATRLVERKKSEIIGKHQRILHPPEEIKGEFSRTFKQHLKEKKGQILEAQVITKAGELRDVEIKANIFQVGDKRMIEGVFRDITERKTAEKTLQESEKRFRELSELLPEVVFEADLTGALTFVNQAAFDRFGYSQEDFDKGLNALQMLVPENRNRAQNEIEKVGVGTDAGFTEYTALRKDGSTFPVMIHSTPIIRENSPEGIRGVIIDITKRKEAEEENLSLAKFPSENPNPVLRIAKDGTILYANKAARKYGCKQNIEKKKGCTRNIRGDSC